MIRNKIIENSIKRDKVVSLFPAPSTGRFFLSLKQVK